MLSIDLTTWLTVGLLVFAGRRSPWTGRLVVLLLLSPGLRYVSALFTFPIRLTLSNWAGAFLRTAGLQVSVDGNVLVRSGQEMAVDPACMGLQMTGTSLLVALFLLIWAEKQLQKQVPISWAIAYGLTAFGLTILCNLFRIIILVAFGILPGTWAHEAVGLLCVAVYAWLPASGLATFLVTQFGRRQEIVTHPIWSMRWSLLTLAAGFGLMAYTARPTKPMTDPCSLKYQYGYASFLCKPLPNGFVQLSKPNILVYLKPLPDWYSLEHNPAVCWRGSGYELGRVRETVLDGHPAYVGELRKSGKTLQTAWWFSNGQHTMVSQLEVRTRMLRGEANFSLVNVTTLSKHDR
ncbi:exosortase N [Spirosoma soli]|uniref:Exosortase N n=1 Tax=Spirosoma soli TaxID=1770529 RepID=A0ABW5M348_9BACT